MNWTLIIIHYVSGINDELIIKLLHGSRSSLGRTFSLQIILCYRNYCNKSKEDHSLSTPYSLIKEALDPRNSNCDRVLAEAVAYDVNVTRGVASAWIGAQFSMWVCLLISWVLLQYLLLAAIFFVTLTVQMVVFDQLCLLLKMLPLTGQAAVVKFPLQIQWSEALLLSVQGVLCLFWDFAVWQILWQLECTMELLLVCARYLNFISNPTLSHKKRHTLTNPASLV